MANQNLDRALTFDQGKTMVQTFCDARGWDAAHGPKDLAIGIVTEAADRLEIFRYVLEAEVGR